MAAILAIGVRQIAQLAGDHVSEVASVDEQDLADAAAVPLPWRSFRNEPQTTGIPVLKKQLVGHGDNAVDEVLLDELAADVALSARSSMTAIRWQGRIPLCPWSGW